MTVTTNPAHGVIGTDNMFAEYPDIVTVDHLMQMLHIGKSSAYALLKSNQIQHVRVGRKYIIPKGAVIGFIRSMCYNDSQIIDGRLHLVTEGDVVQ